MRDKQINKKLNIQTDIDAVFRQAQKAYNAWSKQPPELRTTAALLSQVDFDFFEVLDSVTIARSRKHIQRYYDINEIGNFPERNKPISLRPKLTNLDNAINYEQIYEQLMLLNLSIYTPTNFILASRLDKYVDVDSEQSRRLSQKGREEGIRRLMSINLLKRMESSVHSFKLTVKRMHKQIFETLSLIDDFRSGNKVVISETNNFSDLDLVHWRYFQTIEEARQVIFEYIEVFYNRQRVQKRLGYLSPIQWLKQWEQGALQSVA